MIFGPDRRAYVGQSGNVFGRPTVDLARRLGLDWSIVRYTPGTSRVQREAVESAVHEGYARAGFHVSSIDRKELTRRVVRAQIDIQARSEAIREYWRDPANRAKQAERMRQRNAEATPADRSEWARRAWEIRRRNQLPEEV